MATTKEVECSRLVCRTHHKSFEYFCCDQLLCAKCITTAHKKHDFNLLEDILPEERKGLQSLIEPNRMAASQAQKMMQQLGEERDTMQKNEDDTTIAVRAFFDRTRKDLKEREDKLLTTVQTYTKNKLTKLDAEYKRLQQHHEFFSQKIDSIEKMLQQSDEHEASILILVEKQKIAKELEEHQQSLRSLTDQLSESRHKTFLKFSEGSAQKKVLTQVGALNEVKEKQDAVFMVNEVDVGADDEPSGLYIRSNSATRQDLETYRSGPYRSSQKGRTSVSSDEIESYVEMESDQISAQMPGNKVRTLVKHVQRLSDPHFPSKSGTNASTDTTIYDDDMIYDEPGIEDGSTPSKCSPEKVYWQVGVSAYEEPMPNVPGSPDHFKTYQEEAEELYEEIEPLPLSPITNDPPPLPPPLPANTRRLMKEIKPVRVIGKHNLKLLESTQQFYPCGVCCNDDTIIVTDVQNSSIAILHTDGRVNKVSEGQGGELKYPSAVATDSDQNLFVVDQVPPRVVTFNLRTGKLVQKPFGQKTRLGSQLIESPKGITVANGIVYVSDWRKGRIYCYQTSGKYLHSIGKENLKCPAGIALDKEERLVVADHSDNCVWLMTHEGVVKRKFGDDHLCDPYGVAVGKDGSIIVTERQIDRISIFSSDGELLFCFGKTGSEPGMFNNIRHVCVNSKGQIIVADKMNQRLQVFEL